MQSVNSQLPDVEQTPKPAGLMTGVALASLAVAVFTLLVFSWIATEVREGDTIRFDLSVRTWVHHFFSPELTREMVLISEFGAKILIIAFLAALIGFLLLRWKRAAAWLAVAMAGALVLDLSLKYGFHRARPTPFYGPIPHTYSFPSGHALMSFCFYGVLAGLINGRVRSLVLRVLIWVAAALLILAIGFSRIYLGVHYPSDVLAGYLTAALWVSAMIFLDRLRLHRRDRPVARR